MTSKELKQWRQDHGYSQARLAKVLDVAKQMGNRFEDYSVITTSCPEMFGIGRG